MIAKTELFRCFYCDRVTRDSNAVSVKLGTGLLSCKTCSEYDRGNVLVEVHGVNGALVFVARNDIDAECDICGSADGEPCA